MFVPLGFGPILLGELWLGLFPTGAEPQQLPQSCSNLSSSPSPLLCPSPQLYLQARAPPEGDSDLATWLLTEPDVQKVPPWG